MSRINLLYTAIKIQRSRVRFYTFSQEAGINKNDNSDIPIDKKKLRFYGDIEAPYNSKINLIKTQDGKVKAAPPINIYDKDYDPILFKYINLASRLYGKGALHMVIMRVSYKYAIKKLPEELKKIHPDLNLTGLQIFNKAISNVKPQIATRVLKKGDLELHKPQALYETNQVHWALKWIKQTIEEKMEKKPIDQYEDLFIKEIIDAYEKKGYAWEMRQKTHKRACANIVHIHSKF